MDVLTNSVGYYIVDTPRIQKEDVTIDHETYNVKEESRCQIGQHIDGWMGGLLMSTPLYVTHNVILYIIRHVTHDLTYCNTNF